MTYNEIEGKLTPAARQAIQELVEDYKRQILLGASESATDRTGYIREISVHDILTGLNRVKISPTRTLTRRLETILTLYLVIGLSIAVFGLVWFLYSNFLRNLDFVERLPFIVSIAGLILASISALALWFKKTRGKIPFADTFSLRAEPKDPTLDFVRKWQEVEIEMRNLTATRLGESKANEPISDMIDGLYQSELLSNNDVLTLKKLLNTRNYLVHTGGKIQKEEFRSIINDLDRITSKLRQIS